MDESLERIIINIFDVFKLHKYSPNDIKNISTETGVYFLFDYFLENDAFELVYIGQSKRLKQRLRDHYRGSKLNTHSFSYFSYIDMEDMCVRQLHELAYICHYKPEFNGVGVNEHRT